MTDFAPAITFALLLVRPGTLIAFSPAFGGTFAPPTIKIGLTVFLALALLPVSQPASAGALLPLVAVAAREAAIGLALALAIRVIVAGAELGGHLAGAQMGLTYGATIDPQSGVRNPLLSILYGNLALVMFLAIDGHHAFLRALVQSYAAVPMGLGGVGPSLPEAMAALLGAVFVFGARIAAPVMAVLIVTEAAMALIARSAPALNLMAVGAPIRLIAGLLALPAGAYGVAMLVPPAARALAMAAMRAAEAFK